MHPAGFRRRASAFLVVVAVAATVHGQADTPSRSPLREVLRDLAAKLATSLTRTEPFDLAIATAGGPEGVEARWIQGELIALLRARNLEPAGRTDSTTHVTVTCTENVHGHLCAGEIVKAGASSVALAARPRAEEASAPEPAALMTLSVRPVFAQARQMLDLVLVERQRMIVLDVDGVTLYERGAEVWKIVGASPFGRPWAWPRDARGRLAAAGNTIEAFLPGRSCRGTVEPFVLTCADARPWPLGIENDGLAEGRNHFASPRLSPFYSVAALPGNSGPAWLIAGIDGQLRLFDGGLAAVGTVAGSSDDIAALSSDCAPGRAIVLMAEDAADGKTGTLRAYEIAGGQRVPLAPAVSLPGALVALWPSGDGAALAIVRNPDVDRHEAYLVGLACAR